jgi:hypothetical protein
LRYIQYNAVYLISKYRHRTSCFEKDKALDHPAVLRDSNQLSYTRHLYKVPYSEKTNDFKCFILLLIFSCYQDEKNYTIEQFLSEPSIMQTTIQQANSSTYQQAKNLIQN